jgi:3-oxoacyl-[acyl-carrier protein] reductase
VVGSIAGLEALGAPAPYVAAKLGLVGVVKEWARKYAASGIRINVVAPGNILAPGGAWEAKLRADHAGVMAMIEREVPMQRFGEAAEIARTVAFLASRASSFTTGACVVVDGGQTRAF